MTVIKNYRKFRKSQMKNNFQNPKSYPKTTIDDILVYFLQVSLFFFLPPSA